VDFPYLLFADQTGLPVPASKGKPGVGWMRVLTDVPVVLSEVLHGRAGSLGYFGSLWRTRVESVFSARDPLPTLAELLLLPYLIAKKCC
jgi:hypothetical protein